jgi:hypothetical protein
MRWQLTKQQREMLGEIDDAAYAVAKSMQLMGNDIATYKLYADVAQNYGSDFAQPGYVQMSSDMVPQTKTPKFGKLAGMYLPQEIADDLTRAKRITESRNQPGIKQYLAANRWWKMSKTALNPVVHTNNVISNIGLYYMSDSGWSHLGRSAKELLQAKRGQPAPLLDAAKRAGVMDAGQSTQELSATSRKLLEEYAAVSSEPKAPLRFAQQMASKTWEHTGGRMLDAYQAEDSVFRLAIFSDRLAKGMNVEEAAKDARRWLIDYEINAPLIQFMRDTTHPFFAYSYRLIPLLAETAIKRPWKFAVLAALVAGVNYVGEEESAGNTKAERASMPERMRSTLWGVPGAPSTMVKLPTQSEPSQYLDIKRWLPGGDVFETGDISSQLPGVPQPLQISGGLMGSLYNTAQGFDPFTGKRLPGLGVSAADDWRIRGEFLHKQLTPNFPGLPGSYSTQKISDSLNGVASRLGDVLTPKQAIAQSLGIKIHPIDVEKGVARNRADLRGKLDALKEQQRNYAREFQLQRISEEQYNERLAEILAKREKLLQAFEPRVNIQ